MERAFWQAVLDADGAMPEGHTAAELLPELVGYLGSTDPFLRDEVSFEVLAAWIVRDQRYGADELRALGDQLARNMARGLGELGTDSVFLRSFSALVLNKVIEADNWHALLDPADIRRWLDQALAYIVAERDLRGLVPGKGWAHAIAHAADVLWVLAQSRHLAVADLERILWAVAERVIAPGEQIYLYNEDQRLASAVVAALQRELLDLPTIAAWLGLITEPSADGWSRAFQSAAGAGAYHNTTTFLRSLYLQLLLGIRPPPWYPDPRPFERAPALREPTMGMILGALRELDRGFYAKEGWRAYA